MKIQGYKVDEFIARPDARIRAAVIYGPDRGLMKERADTLARKYVADLNDTFNVSIIDAARWKADASLLEMEAQSQSLLGGMRLVRVRDAEDGVAPALENYLKNPNNDCFIVLEASDLSPRSVLRKLAEKHAACVALPCYVEEGADLERLIRQMLATDGWQVSRDALQWLATAIVGDRMQVRAEVAKLALYMGKGDGRGTIQLGDARAAIADAAEDDIDMVVQGVADRDPARIIKGLLRLESAGQEPIAIIRWLGNHFRRLHKLRCDVAGGMSITAAIEAIQPPVFFKAKDRLAQQTRNWSLPQIEQALQTFYQLESRFKTSQPAKQATLGQALLKLAA